MAKKRSELPSGLTYREEYLWLKSQKLCVKCRNPIEETSSSVVLCTSCNAKRKNQERIAKAKRKEKHEKALQNLNECIESATVLGLSYGEYMLLRRKLND